MIELLIIVAGFGLVMVLCMCKAARNADDQLDEYYSRKDYVIPTPFKYTSETVTYKPKKSKFIRRYIPRYLRGKK